MTIGDFFIMTNKPENQELLHFQIFGFSLYNVDHFNK